ncbi:DUF6470 family protein [Virgibacillus sp. C22-A2]|uniref:DUF6470 family protein n=1 Tax=Virgibacillus tibetensis TaxID=3042313 RepID=A0ABU6KCJ3_9BACI|nr:DUF6470 family protein [Virgibacillus sp. C22-A2]
MRLPQIRLESQRAEIQIQQSAGKQEIRQPKADMTIQQPKAELSITTSSSKLQIDQTQAWEDMNLMHIFKRNDRFAQEGRSAAQEGMGRRAQQGTEMMRIENEGNPLVNQAVTNGHTPMKALGIKFIPSQFAVKTSYQPSEVKIEVQTNKPIIESTVNKPEHTYERSQLEISMKQHHNLDIDFINLYS